MLKRVFLFACCTVLLFQKVQASHLMGGEITWACQGGGQYIFTMKLYRDCNGATVPPSVSIDVANLPGTSSITLNLISQTDISPVCNAAGPAITCSGAMGQPGWPSSSTPVAGAVQETVYQSGLVTLNGVPPASGWIFTYTGCCRNNNVSNLQSPSTHGYTLRAVMYNYRGQNGNPCFDSSPKFLELPSTVICLGSAFTYNYNAYDPDLDSLYYSWAAPLDEFSNPIPFASGYTANSPLPGTLQSSMNVAATINPFSGEISFTSYTQGSFVTDVKVQAWKCGQLVAEIYREIQIVLLPCATNTRPAVTFSSYQDTVVAGSLVNFTVNAHDPDFLSDGVTPQTLSITATGNQFGTGFTNASSGCSNPPCAILSPVPPASAPTNASTTFNWQTSCNHISTNSGCNSHSNTYTFVFKTKDDFCPAPAEKISTVSITVLAPPLVASPQPHCVTVQANGDVTLTWAVPSDPNGIFNSYQIYTSTSAAGPFMLLDSIFSLTQNTYTHVGANAQLASVYYYICTRSGCSGQIISPAVDTVRSMLLNVTNPGNGTAVLNWNAIASPPVPGSSGVYKIYQEYPAGVWTLTGTSTNSSFIDTIFVCNGAINYKVEIADVTGCTSISSIDGGSFANTIVPATPSFDTLSVDDNNHAIMSWNPSISPDVEGYVIYKLISGWQPIDTVYGINTTNYINLLSTAGTGSEQYRLIAFDSCGGASLLNTFSKTIYLTATADICARSAKLSWTASSGLGTGLEGYRIYLSTVGITGPFTLLGTVGPGTLSYSANGLPPNQSYYFRVTAFDVSGTKTASSNRLSFYSAAPVQPQFSYLRKVSVADPDRVIVTCYVDSTASTSYYKIMRSTDPAAGYARVGNAAVTGSAAVVFTDGNVKTDKHSYYYKVINVDSCGYDGIETNIGRTILVSATGHADFTNTIVWNDYEDWSGNVMSYNIYRGVDGVMDPVPIGNVPYTGSDFNFYTDDISMLLQGEGVFNYYVEALEGMGNTYGFSDNSISNITEAYQDPQVFIPNSFKPTGVNNVFIPVTSYVDLTDYEFYVYNRWGLKVFSTTDVNEGWDGTHSGHRSELGVYVYLIRFKTSRGDYIEKKGTITLIR